MPLFNSLDRKMQFERRGIDIKLWEIVQRRLRTVVVKQLECFNSSRPMG